MQEDFGQFYKVIRKTLQIFFPRFTLVDHRTPAEQKEAVVYVSHHQNLFGPVSVLLWQTAFVRTWILSVFMDYEACYNHYVDYTMTKRYRWPEWLAKIVAPPLAAFASKLTISARGIPVYRQSREVIQTMKLSVEALKNGQSILLFPDVQYDDKSKEVKEIYEGFLFLEKYYYRETGQHVSFVPVYSDKVNRQIKVGEPVLFPGNEPFVKERKQVAERLQVELNRLALAEPNMPADTV